MNLALGQREDLAFWDWNGDSSCIVFSMAGSTSKQDYETGAETVEICVLVPFVCRRTAGHGLVVAEAESGDRARKHYYGV